MVSAKMLVIYTDWKLPFKVHTSESDKKLCSIIILNNKKIAFLSIRLIKPQHNYTTTEKDLLAIVECLKQFRGIQFG